MMIRCLGRVQRLHIANAHEKKDSEKCMISIIWCISGIHRRPALTKGTKYNSQYFCQRVILDIQQNICSSSRRKAGNGIRFSGILAMHQLTIRDFLQKTLNPQKPKEHLIHLIAQTQHQGTSFSLII
jgi:hypothetical protein